MLKCITDINLKHKTVLLRGDLNLPTKNGVITSKARLHSLKPTITKLLQGNNKIILIGHLGQPKGVDNNFSLKPFCEEFAQYFNCPVHFEANYTKSGYAQRINALPFGSILLLENLRFHKGETKDAETFAKDLAIGCDYYVNDAFSVCHRRHASIHAITKLLPSYAGASLKHEIKMLEDSFDATAKPIMAIVGGAKIQSKITLLQNLIHKVDFLMIGGGMANVFLAAQGYNIGKSINETDCYDIAKNILEQANNLGCELILPTDVVVAKALTANIDSRIVAYDAVPDDLMILDVGPKTTDYVNAKMSSCKTLFWNGPIGVFEVPPFHAGTSRLARYVGQHTSSGKLISIAGGGDTVAALEMASSQNDLSFISTGGGAFLQWLEGNSLPGITALLQQE